jgi:hypothetical protein
VKARLWRVVYGPEWQRSVDEADPRDGYFEDDLDAVEDALGLNPLRYSFPFLDEQDDMRIFTTRDEAAGYRVIVFCRVDRAMKSVELCWVEREDLE